MLDAKLHRFYIDSDMAADRGDQVISKRIKLGRSQIRGLILKALLSFPVLSVGELVKAVGKSPERTTRLIHALIREGFLKQAGDQLCIAPGAEAMGSEAGNL